MIPRFKSEGQEAAWWEKHRAAVEADLRAGMRAGQTVGLQDVLAQGRRKKNCCP
ncbi:MAG TPA: hypothetical protein VME43_01695 [Bryobacteraceae bacterium]|nr:hypothetical protein [Bryobacteraceae bacterium]